MEIFQVKTMKEAHIILASEAKDVAIRKEETGEYRVNKRGGREATAYYSDDLTDAVQTGIAMSKKGAW